MFCGECGKPVDEGAKFCGECGAVADATIAAPGRHTAPTSPGRQVPPEPARSQQGWFWLGGIFGVICVRLFFLDGIEELGWRIFWEELAHGRILEPGTVLGSSTFMKSAVGFFIAGFLVWAVRVAMEPNSR